VRDLHTCQGIVEHALVAIGEDRAPVTATVRSAVTAVLRACVVEVLTILIDHRH